MVGRAGFEPATLSLKWVGTSAFLAFGALSRGTKRSKLAPRTAGNRPGKDRDLPAPDVLKAHKAQPAIEKRFQQTETVDEIAPVFLRNEGRIEALFTLHFLAL